MFQNNINWKKYIVKTSNRPARALLAEAVQYVKNKGEALDIGAGALMDSKHLLLQRFRQVTAIDNDPASESLAKKIKNSNFLFIKQRFEDFYFAKATYDLINAQNTLQYTHPEKFNVVMENVLGSLKPDGIFVGTFFGDRQENIMSNITPAHISKSQAQELFSKMQILKFEEIEEDKPTVLGKLNHFHELNIIARSL